MMFSSNQKLEVSGPLEIEYIQSVLDFVLRYSGQGSHISKEEKERGCLMTFQTTETGSYCIGWGFKKLPDGWEEYQFDFDVPIVSRIIKQHIEKCDCYNPFSGYDGTSKKGFIMRNIEGGYAADERGIKNPFYGIVEFAPYTVYYAK